MHLTEAEADAEGMKLKGLDTGDEVRRWQGLLTRIEHIARMLRVEVGPEHRPKGGFHVPARIESEVATLENADSSLAALEQQAAAAEQAYHDAADRLGKAAVEIAMTNTASGSSIRRVENWM